jgi:hypothetical protein
MPTDDASQERRSEYDVTNTVNVSSPVAVRDAVMSLLGELYPHASVDPIYLAFHDFERLFSGRDADYHGVDTAYHDIQHSLDMTLALARLVSGYEQSVEASDRLGAERATLAIVTSLFHDAGYLRHRTLDQGKRNGAEFTLRHVTRSSQFLGQYLPKVGLERWREVAQQIVHFTGYEVSLERLELDNPRDSAVGHLLGTADLMAQMADRCYLEKCRDRLYKEFVVGGVAVENAKPGEYMVRYKSGLDLLSKTPAFYQQVMRDRLHRKFNRAYRYIEVLYDGQNPYIDAIAGNISHLVRVIESGDWSLLRREPPYFLGIVNAVNDLELLVRRQLASFTGRAIESDGLLMPI